jgi:hypothetical protein
LSPPGSRGARSGGFPPRESPRNSRGSAVGRFLLASSSGPLSPRHLSGFASLSNVRPFTVLLHLRRKEVPRRSPPLNDHWRLLPCSAPSPAWLHLPCGRVFRGIGAAMVVPCERRLYSMHPLSRKPIAYQGVGRSNRDTVPGQRFEVSGRVIETRRARPANQGIW